MLFLYLFPVGDSPLPRSETWRLFEEWSAEVFITQADTLAIETLLKDLFVSG
jgi:hypothetical protein